MAPQDDINRREFLASAAVGVAAFSIVPRHVLGGRGYVAPSDKITMAYIGCGTQGIRELLRWIAVPEVQITAVCDPVKDATNYIDWDKTGLRDSIRKTLGDPNWGGGIHRHPRRPRRGEGDHRDLLREAAGAEKFRSVASYVDFRELLEKERDLDSVKIMTPDHLHATISLAAMRKKKHVLMHKPLSNRVAEVRMVVDAARKTEWPRTCSRGAGRSPPRGR